MSGCGRTSFDAVSAMEDWVEEGNAPDALLATQFVTRDTESAAIPFIADRDKPPVRTMPICKSPAMAHYSGHGNVTTQQTKPAPQTTSRC